MQLDVCHLRRKLKEKIKANPFKRKVSYRSDVSTELEWHNRQLVCSSNPMFPELCPQDPKQYMLNVFFKLGESVNLFSIFLYHHLWNAGERP